MSELIKYVSMDNYCCCIHAKNKKAKLQDLAIKKKTLPYESPDFVILVTEGRCPFCGHVFTINAINLPAPNLTL